MTTSLLDPTQPAAWLLGSFAAAIVAANLAWLAAHRLRRPIPPGWQITAWLAAAFFCILPPLLAWQARALSPFHLGLNGLDWIPNLLTGGPTAGLMIALFVTGWLVFRRTLPPATLAVSTGLEHLGITLRALLDAFLWQWHWAFYRAAAIGWLATWPVADSLYWGAWLGLLCVAAEWVLNPFARAALRDPQAQLAALRQVALALATTALFALTRNLWLCLICHVLAETIIVGWLAGPGTAHAAPQPRPES